MTAWIEITVVATFPIDKSVAVFMTAWIEIANN